MTRTTLGLMPLAIGILLRHYYDKPLQDDQAPAPSDPTSTSVAPVPTRHEFRRGLEQP
jgi:hypothetical protein